MNYENNEVNRLCKLVSERSGQQWNDGYTWKPGKKNASQFHRVLYSVCCYVALRGDEPAAPQFRRNAYIARVAIEHKCCVWHAHSLAYGKVESCPCTPCRIDRGELPKPTPKSIEKPVSNKRRKVWHRRRQYDF